MDSYKTNLDNIIKSNFALTEQSAQGLVEAHALIDMVAESFGGCVKCWGKGYVIDLGPEDSHVCDCDRGDKLKVLAEVMYLHAKDA